MDIPVSVWLGLISIVVIIFQVILLYNSKNTKDQICLMIKELGSIWKMVDTHGHTIKCEKGCFIETDKVIINESV